MPTTGADILRSVAQQIGKDYTGQVTPAKLNPIIKRATSRAIEKVYLGLVEQDNFDDIRSLINTNVQYTPTLVTNTVSTVVGGGVSPSNINDYDHLLAVKAQYNEPLFITVSTALNTTPVQITLSGENNIANGDVLFFSGSLGMTSINGVRYPKMLNEQRFELYLDKNFTQPLVPNGTYTANTANVFRYFYQYCKRYYSDRKISLYDKPTSEFPKFENGNSAAITGSAFLRFYPLDIQCNQITIDYIKTTSFSIDTADNIVDVELVYPDTFIYMIVSEAVVLLSGQYKDQEAYTIAKQNPIS